MTLPDRGLASLRIERQTLAQQVLDRLVLQLLNTPLKAGDRVATELQLMEEFDVSRSSIREAVKALQNLGILDSRPALGTFVSDNEDVYARLLVLASLLGTHNWEEQLDMCASLAAHGLMCLRRDLQQGSEHAAAHLAQLQRESSKGKSVLQFYGSTLVALANYPTAHTLNAKICAAMVDKITSQAPNPQNWKIRETNTRYQRILAALSASQSEFSQASSAYFSPTRAHAKDENLVEA